MGPTIGPNYLMHLWQNPHHTDWNTYQKNKTVLDTAHWIIREFLNLARTDNRCEGGFAETSNDALDRHQSRQSKTEQHQFRRSYLFHTIPKSLGYNPDPNGGAEGGVCLVESFQRQRFLIIVAVILEFIVYVLILGVYFRYVAGLQGLKLYTSLLWLSSWITGLSTFIIIFLIT